MSYRGNKIIRTLIRRLLAVLASKYPGALASSVRRAVGVELFPDKVEILHGKFKGVALSQFGWSQSDRASIGLGQYEIEVQNWLDQNVTEKPRIVVVAGAGEGLYALGLHKCYPDSMVHAFESNPTSRRALQLNWRDNGFAESSLSINGFFKGSKSMLKIPGFGEEPSLLILDVEGDEFSFVGEDFLDLVKDSSGVIEIHSSDEKQIANLHSKITPYCKVDIIRQGPRNPSQIHEIKSLPDDLKWSIMSEGRQHPGLWFGFSPIGKP